MIRINLLPVRLARRKENVRRQISIYFLSIIFIALVTVYISMSFSKKIEALNSNIEQVQSEIKGYDKIAREVKEQKKQKDLIQKKLDVLNQLQRNKTGPVHILDEISANLPEKRLWLKAIKQDGKRLLLEGIALDNETIASYMKRLTASPHYFTNVDLVNSEQEMVKGIKLMRFAIVCETKVLSVETQ